jgi:hypothetical protein
MEKNGQNQDTFLVEKQGDFTWLVKEKENNSGFYLAKITVESSSKKIDDLQCGDITIEIESAGLVHVMFEMIGTNKLDDKRVNDIGNSLADTIRTSYKKNGVNCNNALSFIKEYIESLRTKNEFSIHISKIY